MNSEKTIVTQMNPHRLNEWVQKEKHPRISLPRRALVSLSAGIICLTAGAILFAREPSEPADIISRMTTGFEYDENIGRLQFVSNILPESAMVFLDETASLSALSEPTQTQVTHVWSENEPWLEYACNGMVSACKSGEVMTVVRNREGEYTVRVIHNDGYESIYSGLTDVSLVQSDLVSTGDGIGYASGYAAFELRKDGMSVMPTFGDM